MTRPGTASATPSRRMTASLMTVTVVVIARTREGAGQVLAALLAQDRIPDRVLLVDASIDGLGDMGDLLDPVDDSGIDVLKTTLGPSRGVRRYLPSVIDAVPRARLGRDQVWVLTSRARPHPEALHRLLAASTEGVGMTLPKLVDAEHPDRIVGLGLQATKTGRLVPQPIPGTPDDGAHDNDVDSLGAPLEGVLLDRETFEQLGGHDPSLGDVGGDLDLGWRSQRAGRRAVLVPAARVAVTPTPADEHPTTTQRRQARRAALTRANLLLAPFLALWILLGSLVTGLGLLLAKRPRMALEEWGDAGAALDPRTLRSRLRGRAPRGVPRRHLRNLFVTAGEARHRLAEEFRGPTLRTASPPRTRTEGARGLARLAHPLPWLLLATIAMTAWAARPLAGGAWRHGGSGLVGGELLGGRATAGQLWDDWQLGWHGSGWGDGLATSPARLLLAAAAQVVEWLPGTVASPAGVVITVLLAVALPLAALVAYTSTRTITARRWPRAGAALAWVGSAPAALAVGEGRVGALVALILLPRIAAGLLRVTHPEVRFSDSVRTALWAGVLASFAPVVGVGTILLGLGLVLLGDVRGRLRGLVLAAVPLVLAGPWLLTLRAEPRRLLTGWGLTDTPVTTEPWQLALGQLPGGAPTTWWTAAVLALGVLALLVPGRRGGSWAVAVTALLGLLGAVGAPHLALGHRPGGAHGAGELVTPWAGTGQLALIGSALVAVLLAVDALPERTQAGRSPSWRWLPALVLPVAALGSGVVLALHTFGDGLSPWQDPRPRQAVAAAEGPGATRTLVVTAGDGPVRYSVPGREPGPLVRDLQAPGEPDFGEQQVADAASRLLTAQEGDRPVGQVLAEQGISHVVLVGADPEQREQVGATDGLTRTAAAHGRHAWSVQSPVTDGHPPSRARVVTSRGSEPLPGTGAHADTDGPVAIDGGSRLVVAESVAWGQAATVSADGTELTMSTRSQLPTYRLPAGTDEVTIDVADHRTWQLVSAVALLLVLYLALPFERPPARARTGEDDVPESPEPDSEDDPDRDALDADAPERDETAGDPTAPTAPEEER